MKIPKVLVISGKKQSGKSTLANFIQGLILLQEGFIDQFEVSEHTRGHLFIDIGDGVFKDINKLTGIEKEFYLFSSKNIKKYELMDDMKNILVNYFGLTKSQVNGENGEKDVYVRYLWENMPGLCETQFAGRTGPMTAREFMQYMGTEIARKIYLDINVEKTYKNIHRDLPEFATINGGRFPNDITYRPGFACEVKTVRLARTLYPQDIHSSETSLDVEHFNWNRFDCVIWNQSLSIEQTCTTMLSFLKVWGWVK